MKTAYLVVCAANAVGLLQRATKLLASRELNVVSAVANEMFERTLFLGVVQFRASAKDILSLRQAIQEELSGLSPIVLESEELSSDYSSQSETRFQVSCDSEDNVGLLAQVLDVLKQEGVNVKSLVADTEPGAFSGEDQFNVTAKLSMEGSVPESCLHEFFQSFYDQGAYYELTIGWSDGDNDILKMVPLAA